MATHLHLKLTEGEARSLDALLTRAAVELPPSNDNEKVLLERVHLKLEQAKDEHKSAKKAASSQLN